MKITPLCFSFVLGFTLLTQSGCLSREQHVLKTDGMVQQLPEESEKWYMLLGTWYGDQPRSDGGRHQWIMTRSMDGTYMIQFRSTEPDGSVAEQTEVGDWGVSGPIYFTIFRGILEEDRFYPSGGGDFSCDAYRILEISEEGMTYENVEGVTSVFEVIRVEEGFEFPDE